MEILYNRIGSDYNSTRKADPEIAETVFKLLNPSRNGYYLDIGCGTGNYTLALSDKGLKYSGIDPSDIMLDVARKRSNSITWIKASADQIPGSGNLYHGISGVLTLHHWRNLKPAFHELCRIMKPGARLVLFTSTPEQMKSYWLNHYFPLMLENSILQMPALNHIEKSIEETDLKLIYTEKYFVTETLQDHFLYTGKHRPYLYFDEQIKRGISSFASLSTAREVSAGLTQLQSDLNSGTWERIRQSYSDTEGDYLFVVMEKSSRD